MSLDDLDEAIRENVRSYGVHVQGVFPHEGDPPSSVFLYSVGLTEVGSPEVLVAGLPMQVGHFVVNEVHRRATEDGVTLAPGVVLPGMLGGNNEYDVVLRPMHSQHEAFVVRRFYGDAAFARTLQVVWPDFSHRYPWDDGYDVDPRAQKDWWIAP